ncbi:flagellar protein FlgN [Methylorubrum populi]|uniref:flagellar protein FlgN n=1 Tax=Methylorubrum TaxID=2282523 RepID=UPI0011547062|nr:flagellar protein FlgN [Methylorubrum populi]QDI79529.1 flagellar protein FlgN [Methylorubrum populi]
MLLDSLKRLEATVETETEALAANAPLDLDAVNRAKSRSLLELTRLARGIDAANVDAETGIVLARLRDKLIRNQEAVALHLRAVEEVGETLQASLQAAESDGTYSARPPAQSGRA